MKELNLCDLLKGHEEELFYSPVCGKVKLLEVNEANIVCEEFPISEESPLKMTFNSIGKNSNNDDAQCIIWPSKELYLKHHPNQEPAWKEWEWLNNNILNIDGYKHRFKSIEDAKETLDWIDSIIKGDQDPIPNAPCGRSSCLQCGGFENKTCKYYIRNGMWYDN